MALSIPQSVLSTSDKKHFLLKLPAGQRDGDSIILSFLAKWNEPLRNNSISVVFRKMHPFRLQIRWMYAYVAMPVGAVVAKAPVVSVEKLSINEAVKLADLSLHSESEIRQYATAAHMHFKELVVYRLGKIKYAKKPVTYYRLRDDFDFFPSPTFIPLSKGGTKTLDKLAGF
jgi:predicted transcriptional regulator